MDLIHMWRFVILMIKIILPKKGELVSRKSWKIFWRPKERDSVVSERQRIMNAVSEEEMAECSRMLKSLGQYIPNNFSP